MNSFYTDHKTAVVVNDKKKKQQKNFSKQKNFPPFPRKNENENLCGNFS